MAEQQFNFGRVEQGWSMTRVFLDIETDMLEGVLTDHPHSRNAAGGDHMII